MQAEMLFVYSCMACIGQLGERFQAEQHQWELWQDICQNCSSLTLWLLEGRIAAHDKKEVFDEKSGYRIRFVKESPTTLDVVRPETPRHTPSAASPETVRKRILPDHVFLKARGIISVGAQIYSAVYTS